MGKDTLCLGNAYTGGTFALCGKKVGSGGARGLIELVSESLEVFIFKPPNHNILS